MAPACTLDGSGALTTLAAAAGGSVINLALGLVFGSSTFNLVTSDLTENGPSTLVDGSAALATGCSVLADVSVAFTSGCSTLAAGCST